MNDYSDKKITFTEFDRYAAAKKLKPTCPMCATNSWTVIDETDELSPTLTFTSRIAPTIDGARAAYLMIVRCNNCSFLAQFDRGLVAQWLNDNHE